jgi:inorganic pyrophosphatase
VRRIKSKQHEVEHFFRTHKELEGIAIETLDWAGVQEAFVEVEASAKRYQAHAAGMG